MYPPNQLLWALIGLLLTILGTFVQPVFINLPWNWADQGIQLQSLDVTYQIGAVLLTGCLGGKNAGALSQIAYIFIGLTFFPFFDQGGGFEYIKEPSFGYLIGFIPGAWFCGWVAFRTKKIRLEWLAFSCICGLLIIHLFGLLYLINLSHFFPPDSSIIPIDHMIWQYSLYPLPGQLVIICSATVIAFALRLILFY